MEDEVVYTLEDGVGHSWRMKLFILWRMELNIHGG